LKISYLRRNIRGVAYKKLSQNPATDSSVPEGDERRMNYHIERLDLDVLVPRLGAGQRFTDELFQFAPALENASNDKIFVFI
jgi:hypothetical protein